MKVSVGWDSENSLKIVIVSLKSGLLATMSYDLVQHCFIGVDCVHASVNNLPSFVLCMLLHDDVTKFKHHVNTFFIS